MKGIFPPWCRIAGYALLILSVFAPMILFLFGHIDDSNFTLVKQTTKTIIGLSLVVILFTRTADLDKEDEKALRLNAVKYGTIIGCVSFVGLSALAIVLPDLYSHVQSMGMIYLVIYVICLEFFFQKRRIEVKMHRN